MKSKKYFGVFLSFLLVLSLLCGCGAKSNDSMVQPGENKGESAYSDVSGSLLDGATTGATNQKLVRNVWITAETEDMDALLSGVNQQIVSLGGYVEARNVSNGSQYSGRRYRSAEMTIRIPADKMDGFVKHVSDSSNITNSRETADDITMSYVETQSRITALETEQTRLLELLADAGNMTDLLEIEKRLTEVRSQLETVTSQLKIYDNQVSYGTIYLTISEVTEYTVTDEPTSVWQRIGVGLKESLKNLGTFFTDLFVLLVVSLPYLVLVAVVVLGVFLLIKLRKRHKRASKKEERPEE